MEHLSDAWLDRAQKREDIRIFCDLCDREIDPAEEFWDFEGRAICEDCLNRYVERHRA